MKPPRPDLTRWNRAGLSKINYIDANAPVFLEHLRARMLAGYCRKIPTDQTARNADFWFNLLNGEDNPLPAKEIWDEYIASLAWAALADTLPKEAETTRQRNARLEQSYKAVSADQGIEIMRAFARACHVFGSYIDAYMNESYLGTATQWTSLAKLGQMVNYAPLPAASASTLIALDFAQDAAGKTVTKGLAMSATPPDGGTPLVFETLSDLTGHPTLNAARCRGWDFNNRKLDFKDKNTWLLNGEDPPGPGEEVVLAGGPTGQSPFASRIGKIHETDEDRITLELESEPKGLWLRGSAELWYAPDLVASAEPVSKSEFAWVRSDVAGQLREGAVVEVRKGDGTSVLALVRSIEGRSVGLTSESDLSSIASLRPLTEYDISKQYLDLGTEDAGETAKVHPNVYFSDGEQIFVVAADTASDVKPSELKTGVVKTEAEEIDDTTIDPLTMALRFVAPSGTVFGGSLSTEAEFTSAVRLGDPPPISLILNDPSKTVAFAGKPPKSLTSGTYFLARKPDGTTVGLRVEGFRVEEEKYWVHFDKDLIGNRELTVFLGPMTAVLRPLDYDRDQGRALDSKGWVILSGLDTNAQSLVRQGRELIIEDERPDTLAPLASTVRQVVTSNRSDETDSLGGTEIKVRLDGKTSDLRKFISGWTRFRLNATIAGHGETQDGQTLGSGNGERSRQSFPFEAEDISFIADASALAGVRPDMDVRVDGTHWDYADLTDPAVEGLRFYSIRVRDDNKLDIVFRQRLPSGNNNVQVSRFRTGTGSAGNQLPAGSFTEPAAKTPAVSAIRQPFETAGGAEREDTGQIRENAGAAIAANGRAVTLEDFTRLIRRHASVWDARAHQILQPGRREKVRITVVPADGVALDQTLEDTLGGYLKHRRLPGTEIEFAGYSSIPLTIEADLRIDPARVFEQEMRETAEAALIEAFALKSRRLGQSFFISEILAVLESLDGLETAHAVLGLRTGTTLPAEQEFRSKPANALRAVYPRPEQAAYVAAVTDISLNVTEAVA